MLFSLRLCCLFLAFCFGVGEAAPRSLWGSYGGPACEGQKRLKDFEELVGFPQTVVVDFLSASSWQAMGSTARLVARCHPSGQGRRLVMSVPMLPHGQRDRLEDVVRGVKDPDYRAIAQALVSNGHGDAVIRLGWEFNGNWFPWTARGRESQWQAAWRRIVTVMRSVEGQSFLFDWTYTLSDYDSYPVEQAYPGDDVVDIIGADVYHQTWFKDSPDEALRWHRYVHAPRGLNWLARFAKSRAKPISLPEWGTGYRSDGHGAGDSPAFVVSMLGWVERNNVFYHSYWNYPARDYMADLFSNELRGARQAYVDGMREQLKKRKSIKNEAPAGGTQ